MGSIGSSYRTQYYNLFAHFTTFRFVGYVECHMGFHPILEKRCSMLHCVSSLFCQAFPKSFLPSFVNSFLPPFCLRPLLLSSEAMNIVHPCHPLWRWIGDKAPKIPYFQRCCHPITPYFCWLSLLSPKDPTLIWWNVGSLIALTQRPPIFLHSAATGRYFFFNFINKLIIFAIFDDFFSNSCF